MSQPKPRPDVPGYYECHMVDDTVRCPVWWDGEKLWPSPDAMASLGVTLYTDFIGPLTVQQAGLAEATARAIDTLETVVLAILCGKQLDRSDAEHCRSVAERLKSAVNT